MGNHIRPAIAEAIGTFMLVLFCAGTICTNSLTTGTGQPQPLLVGIALAQGFILAVALATTVPVAGGYLNPVVTFTLWVFRRLDGQRACWFLGAQVVGAVLAGAMIRSLFTDTVLHDARFGAPHLNLQLFGGAADGEPTLRMLLSGIGIELALTFLLTFVIYATCIDPRGPQTGGVMPGLVQASAVFLAYPLTGAALNPARWLGPTVWEATLTSGALRDHAVYWIGPLFGALLAGFVYERVIGLPAEGTEGMDVMLVAAGPMAGSVKAKK
jgi:aquaporin Z